MFDAGLKGSFLSDEPDQQPTEQKVHDQAIHEDDLSEENEEDDEAVDLAKVDYLALMQAEEEKK